MFRDTELEQRWILHISLLCLWIICGTGQYVEKSNDVVCDKPVLPLNSYIKGDVGFYPLRERFNLTCKEGYQLIGKPHIKCKTTGLWTKTNANCKELGVCACMNLPKGIFAVNDPKYYTAGITMHLTCSEGYAPEEHDTMTCNERGEWSEPPTLCARRSNRFCRAPTLSSQTIIDDDPERYQVGTVVSLSCVGDKVIVGCTQMVCKQNSQWSECNHRCEAEICLLDKYLMPDELSVKGLSPLSLYNTKFAIGRIITLTCNGTQVPVRYNQAEYKEATTECQPGGTWKPYVEAFKCVRACYRPREPRHAHWVQNSDENIFIPREKVQFQCDHGYEYGNDVRYVKCDETGYWIYPSNACIEIPRLCEAPLLSTHALIKDDADAPFSFGSTVSLTCIGQKEIVGCHNMTCGRDGKWSECEHKCQANVCRLDKYLLPDGVTVDGYTSRQLYEAIFEVNNVVSLSCNSVHVGQTRCTLGGRWKPSIEHFQCVDACSTIWCRNGGRCRVLGPSSVLCECVGGYTGILCETESGLCACPNLPEHAFNVKELDRYVVGTTITIACKDGYRLVGSNKMQCVSGGEWAATTATCKEADVCACPKLPEHAYNVHELDGYVAGTTITIACEYGYHLLGSNTMQCVRGGEWTASTATCREADICACPSIPERAYNVKELDRYLEGTTVIIACEYGYRLVGSNETQCVRGGEWTTMTSTCEEILCTNPQLGVYHSRPNQRTWRIGENLKYTCRDGYTFPHQFLKAKVICTNSGEWSQAPSYCIRK